MIFTGAADLISDGTANNSQIDTCADFSKTSVHLRNCWRHKSCVIQMLQCKQHVCIYLRFSTIVVMHNELRGAHTHNHETDPGFLSELNNVAYILIICLAYVVNRWVPQGAGGNQYVYDLDKAKKGHLPLTSALRGTYCEFPVATQ